MWLWLFFPPLLLIVQWGVWSTVSLDIYKYYIESEIGLVELATPIAAIIGMGGGIALLSERALVPDPRLKIWILMLTLACFYFAGEELSWGQHFFLWNTPDLIQAINDQNETNIHNISSWFDQKPRLLLEIGVFLGGILYPMWTAYQRRVGNAKSRPVSWPSNWPSNWRAWLWPTYVCFPCAVLAIAIRIPERVREHLGSDILTAEIRYSEPQEYYFALFLMLYIASLLVRLRAQRAALQAERVKLCQLLLQIHSPRRRGQ